MTTATMTARKEAAVEFLRTASSGRVREAFDKYTDRSFKHHNAYFAGDAKSLAAAMEKNAAEDPQKKLEVLHVLEDGDLVAVHSRVHMKPGDLGVGLVHLFRFAGDRVVELWDIAQPVPPDSPNENGMF